jgi:hypothetical protein
MKPKPVTDPLEESMAWADEEPTSRRSFGALGLVLVALILMVAVYFGATMLMKD